MDPYGSTVYGNSSIIWIGTVLACMMGMKNDEETTETTETIETESQEYREYLETLPVGPNRRLAEMVRRFRAGTLPDGVADELAAPARRFQAMRRSA